MPRHFSLFCIEPLEYFRWTTSYKSPPYVVFSTFYVSIYLLPHSKAINLFFTFLLLVEE
jgi:hypothetical protein